MEDDIVLKVEGVYKKFSRSLKRNMFYGSVDISKSMLGIRYNSGKLRKGEFWSLDNINFELKKGETIGLVGANGSGKSTLLRLINGIFPPDAGKISVKGRIGALIAVGAGFHPHMTGRENIYLNGVILGMTRQEVQAKFDDIIDFAEIGEFIDAPVSTYSSGMYVRLGFAIAIHSLPDIVLIDEVLAVGDSKFQRKCLDKIKELREKSDTSFILVSHNMQNILSMCNKALLIDHGKQLAYDSPSKIIPQYELLLQSNDQPKDEIDDLEIENERDLKRVFRYADFGTDEVSIKRVTLLNKDSKPSKEFLSEEPMSIEIELESTKELDDLILSLTYVYINNFESEEQNLTPLGSEIKIKHLEKGHSIMRVDFDKTQLTTGVYKIAMHFFDSTYTNPYSQGMYGYFKVEKPVATMINAGKGTPLCWIDGKMTIAKSNN